MNEIVTKVLEDTFRQNSNKDEEMEKEERVGKSGLESILCNVSRVWSYLLMYSL